MTTTALFLLKYCYLSKEEQLKKKLKVVDTFVFVVDTRSLIQSFFTHT